MLFHALPMALLALAAPLAATEAKAPTEPKPAVGGMRVRQFSSGQWVVIRIPRLDWAPAPKAGSPRVRYAPVPPVRFREKRGPRCIAAADLRGAMVVDPAVVELVLTGNRRLRARLDGDCGPLDFYSGFYIKPAADGSVCSGRDVIRARSGAACQISAFRTLKPRR